MLKNRFPSRTARSDGLRVGLVKQSRKEFVFKRFHCTLQALTIAHNEGVLAILCN